MMGASAWSAEIVLPVAPLERDGPVRAIYRTNQLATGKGELSVRWTDVYGRVVEDRKYPSSCSMKTRSDLRWTSAAPSPCATS